MSRPPAKLCRQPAIGQYRWHAVNDVITRWHIELLAAPASHLMQDEQLISNAPTRNEASHQRG
jgi:hypothetical protein